MRAGEGIRKVIRLSLVDLGFRIFLGRKLVGSGMA